MKLNKQLKKTRKSMKVDSRRVIILGAGEVGRHISQRLSKEAYNVIMIDESEDKLQESRRLADIGTYVGNGCNPNIYREIDLNEKDLFIAVANSDESNLIACHIAKAFGCGIKIARVRSHFYKSFEEEVLGSTFWRKLGIEILFNQDEITSKEVLKLVENPGSVEAIDLGSPKMQLVAYRVKENSLLVGRRLIGLKDVPIFNNTLITAAVRSNSYSKNQLNHKSPIYIKAPTEKMLSQNLKKSKKVNSYHEETLIPKGDFRIQEGDVLYVSGLRKDVQSIRTLFDPGSNKKLKHIFILGGSSLSFLLAESLLRKYPRKSIYLILKHKTEAHAVRDQLNSKIYVLLLDIHSMQDLVSEGLDENCIFIGASDNEDDNVLACLLAKEETGARTIVIIQSSIYNHVMPYMEVDAAVSPKMLLVDDVLKSLRENVYDVLFSKGDDAEVLEFVINDKFSHCSQYLRDIRLPKDSIIVAVIRGGEMMVPSGSTLISLEDHIIVFCLKKAVVGVQEFFAK